MNRSKNHRWNRILVMAGMIVSSACAHHHTVFVDSMMDFSSLKTVAVLPFANLTTERTSAERVRDAFITSLLATEALYVVPAGETASGVSRAGVRDAAMPATEEIIKVGAILKADAVITGVVREYGAVRSGAASANVISLSMQMMETKSGKLVWSASTTKGGINLWSRLFGGGGKPMNDITEKAVNDLINLLFR